VPAERLTGQNGVDAQAHVADLTDRDDLAGLERAIPAAEPGFAR
jgi:hypothetical protein